MKKILLFIFLFFSFSQIYAAGDIWGTNTNDVIYCDNGECGLDKGTELVKTGIDDIEKNQTASEYAKSVTLYIVSFVSLLGVLYIIYAGFLVLTGGGDEEKQKKSKQTIVGVLLGIVLMWLAYSIVLWLIGVITTS